MEILYKKLTEITPYAKNPRINDKAVEVVANSILEYGFKNPIVLDKNGGIINGHTRYLASTLLELDEVPVIVADDLNEEQVKAFRIMDNKSSEFADWDYELLLGEIKDIKLDIDVNIETLTGFSELELAEMEKAFTEAQIDIPAEEIEEAPSFDEPIIRIGKYTIKTNDYIVGALEGQIAKFLKQNTDANGFLELVLSLLENEI